MSDSYRKPYIRVIATRDGMFEVYRGELLYGVASTIDEMRKIQEEAKRS